MSGQGAGKMTAFNGKREQYELLRQAIVTLKERDDIGSGKLLRDVEAFNRTTNYSVALPYYTTIDKFRKGKGSGGTDKIDPITASCIWKYVYQMHPELLELSPESENITVGEHDFFHSLVRFFDVHQHRNARMKVDLIGRFAFYHFSETFHRSASPKNSTRHCCWPMGCITD